MPLPGINLPLGMLLAKLLRLSILATTIPALLLTYVSPFIYLMNYKTGALFISSSEKHPKGFEYDLSFWDKVVDFFAHAGPAYLLGSLINALMAAGISYIIFLVIYRNSNKLFKNKESTESTHG